MKVLCIDHGAVLREYRSRYVALAAVAPDLDLTVVAPQGLREANYTGRRDGVGQHEAGYRLAFARFWPARVHRGCYGPIHLGRLIRSLQPDLVHTQGEPETFSSAEICLLRDALSPRSKLLFVSWSNIDLYRQGWPYRLGRLYDWSYRRVLGRADGATVYCGDAARILKGNGFAGRVRHIPWGVDPAAFHRSPAPDVRERLGLRGLVIGFVGRLEWAKGVATLIRAAAASRIECTLLIVGDGPALGEWTGLAADMGVPARWVGSVSGPALPTYLSCMDALVLPSETTLHWKEQFGRVLIEAMACEVPVIGSDSGEIPFVIGDAGLVFRERNVDDLAGKIRSLESAGARADWARKGRARVMAEYTWESVARRTLAFYREVLGQERE